MYGLGEEEQQDWGIHRVVQTSGAGNGAGGGFNTIPLGMYRHIYTYTDTPYIHHTYTYTPKHASANSRSCTPTYILTHLRTYTPTHIHKHTHIHTYTHTHLHTFTLLDAKGRFADQPAKPKTGLDKPKHGKEDPKNEPHVGGNTWAGGTGGSDTAGLGGRGGPYRLDKGHTVHQVSDEAKAEVSEEARAAAAKAAKDGLEARLQEIQMGKGQFDMYLTYRERVEQEISLLQVSLL